MRTLKGPILFILILCFAQPGLADGWPQQRGGGYFKLGFNAIYATQFYEPNGNLIDIPTIGAYTTSFYGEYGFTDRITGILYFPFAERITLNKQVGRTNGFVFFEGDAVTSIADLDVGLRIGLLKAGNTVLSAGLKVGVPTGKDEQVNGLVTSDGELNQLVSLQLGQSFYPAPAYAVAQVGVNNRSEGFSDEFHYGVEFGYTFGSVLTTVGRVRGLEPFYNGDDAIMGGTRGLYANNQRYIAFGVELIYAFSQKMGVTLGVESATRGQSILAAPAFSTGVYMTL